MQNLTGMFRKAAFGGFQKDDVLNYIERMKREYYDYKAQVEETVNELREKLAALQDGKADGADAAAPADDLSDSAAHLKQVADEVCESLAQLLEKLHGKEAAEEEAANEAPAQEPEEAEEAEPESDNPVDSILRGLFSAMPQEEVKPAAPAKPKDADLIESVLPKYLQ